MRDIKWLNVYFVTGCHYLRALLFEVFSGDKSRKVWWRNVAVLALIKRAQRARRPFKGRFFDGVSGGGGVKFFLKLLYNLRFK